MEHHSSLVITIGGTCVFLLGMSLASEALQSLAANRMRELIKKLSHHSILGVLLGMALTILVQSSGAVTCMLVGLGSAGVMNLRQVMSIILGTAIGTTFTVQILSLNVAQYGLTIFTFTFPIYFLSRHRILKESMSAAMGFGLIFWGLELIGIGTHALRDVETFAGWIKSLNEAPLLTVAVTALITAVLHSSAVTIGFAMTLAASGQITLFDSLFWVFGANIGTTATALLASTNTNAVGRQIAWSHLLFKVTSALLFVPFTGLISEAVATLNVGRDIANFHTAFNVISAIIFLPFLGLGARVVERLFPPLPREKEFSVKFLRQSEWDSPSVILAQGEREVLRMADIVVSMVKDSLKLFRLEDPDLEASIRQRDNKVDLLNREISLYLTQHMEGAPQAALAELMRLVSFTADLESAADVIDHNILNLARKKHVLKIDFSQEGWKDLEEIARAVADTAQLSVTCFQMKDRDLASKVIFHKRNIRKLENRMRESHIERLMHRKPDSINTSSIHLDLLSDYRRMVGLLANHCYTYLKDSDRYNILPRREL